PVATRNLPTQPLGPVYWGTNKYVEFVALSAHPQALAYAASSLRVSTCAWCNEPLAAKPCPFCASNATRTTPSRSATPHPAPPPPRPAPPPAPPRPPRRPHPPRPAPPPRAPPAGSSPRPPLPPLPHPPHPPRVGPTGPPRTGPAPSGRSPAHLALPPSLKST